MPQTSTMLLPNSYTYMPQDVQDCRLPGLKPSKRFRRPPRQQLLHAPGRSRLPFARPQTLQTLPQASKATTLTATTCPCHLFFRGFKTAVCPPSNPPNASNAPAGLQGNNSYSYMPLPSVFQGVQDCRLPALKPPKRFQRSRRPPRQQLLQLHVPKPSKRFQPSRRPPRPCHLFFRGSRLPFARPQPPKRFQRSRRPPRQQLLQLLQGFKTAVASKGTRNVCPASNPPNASARLQGNNSYSYMPLPSVFQGVQDCRLPALKPPKRFQRSRRPPRQQLLQLHAPAICFSRGSRLPFARPQTSQTLLTLPQASKATTLTATLCQLHAPDIYHAPAELLHLHAPGRSRLPFARPQTLQTLPQASKATTLTCPRTFKTAVCPASNPPNASAGLQGNNSYSYYMPLPSVFQGVQDCRLPALKPPKRFQRSRRPPRQQLLQLHAPAICFSGGSRLPFARPQTPQTLPTLPQASKATTLTATLCQLHATDIYHAPAELLHLHAPGRSRLPFARPQTLQTLPQASKATTLTATTCPCHLFFRGFKTAVCPPSNPPNASNAPAGLQGNNSYSYMPLPSVFQGVQDCRLPALKPPKRFQRSRRPPRQQLLQLHVPKPSKRFQPSASQALPSVFQGFKTAVCPPSTPQTLPTLPQASKATTLTATTCPCHLFFRGFKTAVCPPSNPPNASNAPAGLQGNNSYSYMPLPSVFQGVQDCRLPALKPPKRFQRSRRPPRQQLLQLPSVSYMPQTSTMLLPNSYTYMPQDVQDCRLPGLKPSKRFRRPPRQQLLQLLHAPAICFSGGSRLPFARPQTPQTLPTLPQASKATTLTATCPCHLFFRGFKTAVCRPQTPQTLPTLPQASTATTLTATCPQTLQTLPTLSQASQALPSVFQGFKTAVCPPSNPPNASNAPAGLQGNNSYSYMSSNPDLTDVFFLLGKLCGYCVPTAAWALHVSRALRYHACAFEANDASAADCGLSRQSLATFGTNKAWIAAAISTGDMRIRRSWMSWGVSQYFILVASPQWRHEYSPISIIIPLLRMEYI